MTIAAVPPPAPEPPRVKGAPGRAAPGFEGVLSSVRGAGDERGRVRAGERWAERSDRSGLAERPERPEPPDRAERPEPGVGRAGSAEHEPPGSADASADPQDPPDAPSDAAGTVPAQARGSVAFAVAVSVTPSLPPAAPGGDPAPAPATGANTARPADGGPVAPAATDAPAPAALDAPTGPDATAGAAVAGAATTGEERASTAERAPAAETTDPGAATTAARPTDRISPSGAPAVAVPTPDLASIDDSATAAPAPAGVSGVATEPSAEPRPAPDAPDAPVDVSASPPGASGAAARVEASAPVARAEGADRSAPPRTAEPPAEQLVRVLRPFRHSPTGSYRMDLELRPPELGRVELRVEVTDGLLNASLRVENETAAQVIRDALDTLRQRLEANGIRSGALHVDDGRSGAHRRDGRGDQPTPRPVPDDDVQQSRATEPAGASTSDSNLDVRI